jgi:hypothetical protein
MVVKRMKRVEANAVCLVVGLFLLPSVGHAQHLLADWVNEQGCYAGLLYTDTELSVHMPVPFVSKGSGTEAERAAALDQMSYWNQYAEVFEPSMAIGLGQPGNGINEINTLITSAEARGIYGRGMPSEVYGRAIIQPLANFGGFNECKDFDPDGADYFDEVDILINADYESRDGLVSGWTTDPNDYTRALVQTTVLHELGHAWGAHHVFSLPAFGDSYSTMNYINDDSGRFVTRMDASTIRAAYSSLAELLTDIGIFPLTFGNSDGAETYASVSPTTVSPGEDINLNNYLIQNIGNSDADNVVITFYLSTDRTIANDDTVIGSEDYGSYAFDREDDRNVRLPLSSETAYGDYYIGAIVTVDGEEDVVSVNNRFIVGRPARTIVTVTGCSGGAVTVQNDFVSGSHICEGDPSIETSGYVNVEGSADVQFIADNVILNPGFRVEKNAIFSAGP